MCTFTTHQITNDLTTTNHHILQHPAVMRVQTSILTQEHYNMQNHIGRKYKLITHLY